MHSITDTEYNIKYDLSYIKAMKFFDNNEKAILIIEEESTKENFKFNMYILDIKNFRNPF